MSDSPTHTKSSAPAKDSGKAHGSPVAACKLGTIVVTVKADKGDTLDGPIEVHVAGAGSKSATIQPGDSATLESLDAGEYSADAKLDGWIALECPKITLAAGGTETVTLTLKRAKLKEVTPKAGAKVMKWFINQPVDASKCHGRQVEIVAKLDLELAGVPIYFTLDAKGSNNASLSAGLAASLSAEEAISDGKGEARIQLKLAQYGGDQYRVSASTTKGTKPGKGDAQESTYFEVWNKVFIEIDNMKRPTGSGTYANNGPFADLKSEYEKHFVQLENTGADSEPEHARVSHELELGPYCAGLQSGTDTPGTHVVLIDTIIWDPEDQAQEFQVMKLKGTKRFAASLTTLDVSQWRKAGSGVELKITKSSGTPAWQSLTGVDSHLSMGWEADDFVLSFDLRGALGLPADSEVLPADVTKLEMRLVLKRYIEGSGAKQGSSSIVGMRTRERSYSGADLKNSTLKTMTHETGHAMGMASKYASDGSEPGTYYVRYGSHCNNDSNGCVMYGIAHLKPAYCDVCSDALRARKLDTLPIDGSSSL